MNAFQICSANGSPIALNTLDEEAANFWQVPLKDREFVSPAQSIGSWYDVIGFAIAYPSSRFTKGFKNAKCTIYNTMLSGLPLEDNDKQVLTLQKIQKITKTYFDLIDHWEQKGYTTKKVNE